MRRNRDYDKNFENRLKRSTGLYIMRSFKNAMRP